MACPFSNTYGCQNKKSTEISYSDYLMLPDLLRCQRLQSTVHGRTVADEHLFIITHQTYELWFKQILYDIDNIRSLFDAPKVDESLTLRIVSGLERIVRIAKLLVDQVLILETMTPLDFLEFRTFLTSSSGFQSLQFRLLENKLGVKNENRINYHMTNYKEAFKTEERDAVKRSEMELSLLELVEKWLERTPGLTGKHEKMSNFWNAYTRAVGMYLKDIKMNAQRHEDPKIRAASLAEYAKIERGYDSVLNPNLHQELMDKGERRLSHQALQGALLISFYRDQPRFSQPHQILTFLMDIDSLLTKWRYNHVMLVQRMLGTKHGSGGSSGYLYLRSTISDRYKVFLDLFNLSTWLIPRVYIPTLSPKTRRKFSFVDYDHNLMQVTPEGSDSDTSISFQRCLADIINACNWIRCWMLKLEFYT